MFIKITKTRSHDRVLLLSGVFFLLRHFPNFAVGQQETAEAVIFKVRFAVVGKENSKIFTHQHLNVKKIEFCLHNRLYL